MTPAVSVTPGAPQAPAAPMFATGAPVSPPAAANAATIRQTIVGGQPAPMPPAAQPLSAPPTVAPAGMLAAAPAAAFAPPAASAPAPAFAPAPTVPTATAGQVAASGAPPVPMRRIGTPVPVGLSKQAPGGAAPPPPPPPLQPAPARLAEPPKTPVQSENPGLAQPDKKQPVFAGVKSSPKKMLMIGLGAATAILLIIMGVKSLFGGSTPKKSATTTPSTAGTKDTTGQAGGGSATDTGTQQVIVYWGLWEESTLLSQAISDFESSHPGFKIDYRKQSHLDYRERLQTAISSGNGPDLFRFHAAWTPMLKSNLAALPAKVMSAEEYKKTFYPVAAKQLQAGGQIVGIPLMYDGLALYYNKEVLKTANAQPPKTWSDVRTLANDLTVPSDKIARGQGIQRAGIALGNATNVEHFADILGLLILQNGGDPSAPASTEVRDALVFYTNFVKNDKVWNENLPSSTVAFARGEVAMMIAPSWRAHEVKSLNPELDFATVPVPKLPESSVSWASYWAEGVSAKSKNQEVAWEFLKYLSSADIQKQLYSEASQGRAFGELYSRTDLAADLSSDPIIGAFLEDAPAAQAWYLSSYTHDNGLNDQTIKYYTDAVTAVLAGEDPEKAVVALSKGVKQVLSQYQAQ